MEGDFDWTHQMNPKTEIKVNTIWQIYYSSVNNIASKATRMCIVTFSNTERYNKLADRMRESVKPYGIDFIHYTNLKSIVSHVQVSLCIQTLLNTESKGAD